MYFLEAPWIALRSFFELGGPVLFFILIATTVMWTFIIERYWFFSRVMPGLKRDVVEEWESRRDTTSWHAHRIRDLLISLLPLYEAQGKSYVHIAFGCTGGRHRSVFTAERMAQGLRDAGFSPTVRHRNLSSRAVDEIERGQR